MAVLPTRPYVSNQNLVWDVGTLSWVKMTQPGGSGGAVTIDQTPLTASAPTAATVGVASAQAVPANALRKGLILVNTSVNRISLGFGAPAVLDSGATLYPGGAFNMETYDLVLSAVNAIASGAGSNLTIQEYV